MSFRRRNVGISSSGGRSIDASTLVPAKSQVAPLPGVRPSPIDGRSTTSTGTITIDSLLAGHAGLALGASLLIEESGTTDYAGALLRVYAAEGLVQGHQVHVVGLPEQWGRDLPGLARQGEKEEHSSGSMDKMKIAWRYEGLGRLGDEPQTRDRAPAAAAVGHSATSSPPAFCHTFDLAKRLVHPVDSRINFLSLDQQPSKSPFLTALTKLNSILSNSTADSVHRIVVPSLLSPAVYPPWASQPGHVLQFLHSLRTCLATYQSRLTIMISIPLSLYPRSSGLVRWMELLSDGVIELVPFPHTADSEVPISKSTTGSVEEPPQGLLRLHRLPIFHECGSGNHVSGDDWAFSMSRRKFSVKPFSLPPIEGDTEAQHATASEPKGKKADLEF